MAPNCCTNCDIKVTQASKALQCQLCDGWTHTRCVGVPESLYEQLVELQLPCLPYVCDACRPTFTKTRRQYPVPPPSSAAESSEEDSLNVTCIPSQPINAEKSDAAPPATSTPKKRRAKRSKRLVSKGTTDPDPCNNRAADSTLAHACKPKEATNANPTGPAMPRPELPKPNVNSRTPPREQCLIVLNLPESVDVSPQARVDHDVKVLRDCLASLFDADENELASSIKLKGAIRLGKRHETPQDHPRPLKIVLGCVEEAQAILYRAPRLKGQRVRILRDLSPEDRVKLKTALEELRTRRANGETNLIIRDFRVVKKKPRIRWIPLSLVPSSLESVVRVPRA